MFANGDKVSGNWVNDKLNGRALFVLANGDVINGSWENGLKHGECVYGVKQPNTKHEVKKLFYY